MDGQEYNSLTELVISYFEKISPLFIFPPIITLYYLGQMLEDEVNSRHLGKGI